METGFLGLFSCFTIILFILSIIFFIDCLTKTYIITNERIIFKTPFKNYELNFDKIESISNEPNILQPIGIGSLLVKGIDGTIIKLKNIPKFLEFKNTLLESKENFNKIQNSNSNTIKNNSQSIDKQPSNKLSELKELKELLDSGALTQEEFNIEKQKILSKN